MWQVAGVVVCRLEMAILLLAMCRLQLGTTQHGLVTFAWQFLSDG
jgi:hypothetical protein